MKLNEQLIKGGKHVMGAQSINEWAHHLNNVRWLLGAETRVKMILNLQVCFLLISD